MSGEWPKVPLGEVTINHDGRRVPVKESERTKGPYPYYGASGVVDHVDKYHFDGEYLLIAEDGENLRTRNTPIAFLGRGKFWVNNHAHIVEGNERALTRYLLYAVLCADVSSYLTGSTMPKLTQGNLNRIPVSLPPISEQKAITHILGTLDDKIELNCKMNETLESMARVIFKSWFINFDPVRAKMDGRWRKGQSLPGLPAELWGLFPDKFDVTELGEIPEGWQTFSFGDLAQQGKGSINPGNSPEDIFTHYSLPSFDAGHAPLKEQGSAIKSNKTPVPDGVVLVSKLNPHIPRIWLVGEAGPNAICSTEFIVWAPKAPANSAFLYCLASLPEFNLAIRHLGTGTSNSHQRVKPEQLREIRVFSASEQAIEVFAKIIRPQMDQILCNRTQSRTIAQARDILLPRLISGELRVLDANAFLKARRV